MVQYTSNEPLYKLHFSELNEDAVKVLSFEGEESLSRLFEYRFELLSEDPELDAASILNKKATFTLTRGDEEPLKIHGIISHFEQRSRTPEYVSYHAVLAPKLWRLNLTYQSEVYQRMDIEKIIQKVLETSGFSGEDYEINLNKSYPELEYVVQYRETNFNFLNRRLEHYGIFYYFDHREDNDVIVFTDANDNLPVLPLNDDLLYNPNKDQLRENETVAEFTCRQRVVTGLVRLKDYNYLYPEKQLMAESQLHADSPGMYYEFGDHFEDEGQAEFLAKIRNEEILSESKVFKGKSDCRLFRSGYKFKMGEHYCEAWNNDYILTNVASFGSQYGMFGVLPPGKKNLPTYENYFEAIPVEIVYRPPRRTTVPRIPGIMSAKIESSAGDEYAFIDDHGRYRAKMFFDLPDRSNGEATLPIRLSQAYSGSGYGMHFPNHAGTELVWACVDGNVDRPLGLGTVPNPSNITPATGSNKAQSVIRTAGLNELMLDDTTGNENILMNATKNHTVKVANDESISVGHDQTLAVKNNRTKTIDNNETNHIKVNRTITVDGTHTETVKKDTAITISEGNYKHDVVAGTADYHVQGALTEKYDANQKTTVANEIEITSNGSKIHITAATEIQLKVGESTLLMKSDGSIELKGINLAIKGAQSVNIKGASVTSEADADHNIKGNIVLSEGAATNTVKGGMVMLNP